MKHFKSPFSSMLAAFEIMSERLAASQVDLYSEFACREFLKGKRGGEFDIDHLSPDVFVNVMDSAVEKRAELDARIRRSLPNVAIDVMHGSVS